MLTQLLVDHRAWTIRARPLATNLTAAEPSGGRFRGGPHSAREPIGHGRALFAGGP
jgi:hypothetical protein